MNPDKQRIAVAEACGWKDISWQTVAVDTGMDTVLLFSGIPDKGGRELPDYLHDLNAMHEAEKVMTHQQRAKFMELLCDGFHSNPVLIAWPATHATASQRAEAFLRTLNLWEER